MMDVSRSLRQFFLYFLFGITLVSSQSLQDKVCYGILGCFFRIDGKSYESRLPPDPSTQKTIFMLTTKAYQNEVQNVTFEDRHALLHSHFDAKCRTFIITHGFTQSASTQFVIDLQKAIFQRKFCSNVIRTNWNDPLIDDYVEAAIRAELIGRQMAVLVKMMIKEFKAKAKLFHLIGHSLGAQIVGFCGKYLRNEFHVKIARITGLDPAGPGFCYLSERAAGTSLNMSDAKFVDIIHTNGGNSSKNQKGCAPQMGHVDFFVNGGSYQPPCANAAELNLGNDVCSHQISNLYFIESVTSCSNSRSCRFKSFPASDQDEYSDFLKGKCFSCGKRGCGELGLGAKAAPGRGKQFLLTNEKSPFCGTHFKLEINTLPSTEGFLLIKLSDGILSSSKMNLTVKDTPSNTQVLISKYAPLNFHSVITARIYSGSIPLSKVKELSVTDDRGHRLYYCNITPDSGSVVQLTKLGC